MSNFASGTYADLAFVVLGQPIIVRYTPADVTWPDRLRAVLAAQVVANAPPDTTIIAVEQVANELTPWHISYDKYTHMLPDEDNLVHHLEWQLYTIGVRESASTLAVHAGAVVRNNKVLLLPALSGKGKTTLTLALLAQGWQVLTDDVCPLEDSPHGLVAQPCDRCCHVSETTLAQLQQLGVTLNGPFADLSEYYRPPQWGTAAPIAWIVAPNFDPDAPLAVTPMTQAETAALLIESSFQQDQHTVRQQWQAAIKLACQAKGVRLAFPALEQGLAAIAAITQE